jgi:hypothetical protein
MGRGKRVRGKGRVRAWARMLVMKMGKHSHFCCRSQMKRWE